MGWKAFTVCAFKPMAGPIGPASVHDSPAARALVGKLRLGEFASAGLCDLASGICASGNDLYVGVYPQGCLIANVKLANTCIRDESAVNRLVSALPEHEILAVAVDSDIRHFGYLYRRDSRRVRARAGNARQGVFLDKGEPLPEEVHLLGKTDIRDGIRIGAGAAGNPSAPLTEDAICGELAIELTKRVFGTRLDQLALRDVKMERFVRAKPSFLGRLLGK